MLYKRGRYYWTRFQWQGSIIDKPTREETKQKARIIESAIRSELAKGNYGILQPKTPPALGEFLKKDFLPFIKNEFRETPKTAIYYEQGAKRLLNAPISKIRIDKITNLDASQFAITLSHLSACTVNQALRALRRALNLSEEWKKIDRAPSITLSKGENQRDRILSDEEVRLYLMACAQPWRDVASMIYCLGMRPGEIYSLRWEQIELNEEGFIQIIKGKSKAAKRSLPLVPAVFNILQSRHRDQGFPVEGWVFPSNSKSGHLEQGSAKNQHLKAIEAINLPAKEEAKKKKLPEPKPTLKPFAPYSLRHTALTNLAPGCDSFMLKTIAGHSSIRITDRYVHPRTQAMTQAFKKLADNQKVVTEGSDSSKSAILDKVENVTVKVG
jgi:integrase